MKERDAFAFGADARNVIDHLDPFAATPFECSIQVVDGEADVVNAGPAFGDELGDRRVGALRGGLEELDQRVTSAKAGDVSSIEVVEQLFGKSKQVAIKR